MMILFWSSVLGILTCWVFYPLYLVLSVKFRQLAIKQTPDKPFNGENVPPPRISFVIAAHNEAATIQNRIKNLTAISDSYPYEIIVGSDGSTDNTVEQAEALDLSQVIVLDFKLNRGRALVHNDCSRVAKGDILIFTDAETWFAPDFLDLLIPCFQDPSVGAAAGRIVYVNQEKTDITRSAGAYWKYEETIRTCESLSGILGFGTGAALAIRKKAYVDIRPDEDIDYAATLLAAANGYNIQYVPEAKAFDYISETSSGAFRTRVRQTSRCFKSVVRILFSKAFFKRRPDVFFAAICHKTFRHLTPVFMVAALFSNFGIVELNRFYQMTLLIQVGFYLLALFGMIFQDQYQGRFKWLISYPYTFTLYNIGRGIGVLTALSFRTRAGYTTQR